MPQDTKKQLAEMEGEAEKHDPLEGIPSFQEFTQNTTFHGIRFIFDGVFKIRK